MTLSADYENMTSEDELSTRDYVLLALNSMEDYLEKRVTKDCSCVNLKNALDDYLQNIHIKNDMDILMTYHNYFSECHKLDPNISGAYRYKYDLDALFLYKKLTKEKYKKGDKNKAKHADIMVSIGTILKYMSAEEICSKYEKWIKGYCLSGNILIMPDSKQKYRIQTLNQKKGTLFGDKIDLFLYNLLLDKNQIASYYFGGTDNAIEWIKNEHLECMFEDGIICNENLKSLGGEGTKNKKYAELTRDELYNYLDGLMKVLEYRNQYEDEVKRVNKID